MANRQTYTVLIPFPTGAGHWSTAGRLELTSVLAAQQTIPAKKATTKKAD